MRLGRRLLALAFCVPLLVACGEDERSGEIPENREDVEIAYDKVRKALIKADTGQYTFSFENNSTSFDVSGTYQLSTKSSKSRLTLRIESTSDTFDYIGIRRQIWLKGSYPGAQCWTAFDADSGRLPEPGHLFSLLGIDVPAPVQVLLDGKGTRWTGQLRARGTSTVTALANNLGVLAQRNGIDTRSTARAEVEFDLSRNDSVTWTASAREIAEEALADGASLPPTLSIDDIPRKELTGTVYAERQRVLIEPPPPGSIVTINGDEAAYERELAACEAR